MKVYLSGPISGVPDYRERFAAAAAWVRETGNEPVNPAENDFAPEQSAFALLVGLHQLYDCEAIAMLPGWEHSAGANIERLFAEYVGLLVVDVPTGEEAPEAEERTFGFGHALEWLKDGFSVCRQGWNGKHQLIYYVPAGNYPPCTEIGESLCNEDGLVEYRAYIAIKTEQGTVVPWVASQTDMLAEDWVVVF